MDLKIEPGRVRGEVRPPCSKSYAQRLLAASLMARGRSVLHHIEFCDDTLSAMRCVEALGAKVQKMDEETLSIQGGLKFTQPTLYVGESGLSTRLFTPIASLLNERLLIEGEGTLLHRPMQMMVEPLRGLGVKVKDNDGYLPFEVCGPIQGGEIEMDASISSQFLTGLLMALPLAANDTTLHVKGAVSVPYLDMTIHAAKLFGIEINQRDYCEFYIPGGQIYCPREMEIEGDWSAAAMLLVAGAVAGEVTVENISMLSKQADTSVCTALMHAGATVINDAHSVTALSRELQAFTFDATNCPDLFPALVALAANAQGESVILGTNRLMYKESNRAESLKREYGKLGIEIDLSKDNEMHIQGGHIVGGEVDGCQDHRVAMSLAVAGLCSEEGVTIHGAECVAKSYPTFFEDLATLREGKE